MNNAKDCIYFAIKQILSEQEIDRIFLPSYGCIDIYIAIKPFDLKIEIYDELDGDRLLERISRGTNENSLIFIVDLLLDNEEAVLQLNELTNCHVIYDRTNSEIIDNCIADFDIYSLGVAKRNALGGGGLLKSERKLTAEHLPLTKKLSIIIKYIVGFILLSPLFYSAIRYIRNSIRSKMSDSKATSDVTSFSYKPCLKIWNSNLDLRPLISYSRYIQNKNDYKIRIETILREHFVTSDVFGVARLLIVFRSEDQEKLCNILQETGFRYELSDYIRVSQVGDCFEIRNDDDHTHTYFIG